MSEERPVGPEEAAAGDADPTPRACEVCGAALDADQTYCLECGSPTPLAPRPGRGMRGLAIVAAAVAVLGLGAGALAYAVSSDDDPSGATVTAAATGTVPLPGTVPPPPVTGTLPPDTSFTSPSAPPTSTSFPTVTAPPASPPPVTSSRSTTTPTETTGSVGTTTEPPGGSGSDWPSGTTAWTVIVSSVRSETEARATKARLTSAGTTAGVLFSSDHAGLRPGYWVVYSGRFSARTTAIARAAQLRPANAGAYARRIVG